MSASTVTLFAVGHYYGFWACKQGTTLWNNGIMFCCLGYEKICKPHSHIKPAWLCEPAVTQFAALQIVQLRTGPTCFAKSQGDTDLASSCAGTIQLQDPWICGSDITVWGVSHLPCLVEWSSIAWGVRMTHAWFRHRPTGKAHISRSAFRPPCQHCRMLRGKWNKYEYLMLNK